MPNSPYTPSAASSTPPAYTPPTSYTPASANDVGHIRLLSIFHYVLAGIMALFSLFYLLYIGMGIAMLTGAIPADKPGAENMGWVLIVMGAVLMVMILVPAGFIGYAGRCLAQHRRPTLCLVVACLSCLFIPLGTVLGIFAIVVLQRPAVKQLFAANAHA